jgi:hypothetical protein
VEGFNVDVRDEVSGDDTVGVCGLGARFGKSGSS